MNIEKLITTWLNGLNLGFRAHQDLPSNPPEELIIVKRIGGLRDSIVIDRPHIALNVWAASNERAAEMAYQIDKHVASLVEDRHISKVARASLGWFRSEDSTQERYQIVLTLVCTS